MIMLRRTETQTDNETPGKLARGMAADRSLQELVALLSRTAAIIEEAALGRADEPNEQSRTGARPTREDLLRHFLSDREAAVLRAMAVQGGTARHAKDVARAVKGKGISRTEFYILWSNLELRGLIARDVVGYRFGAGWVRALATGEEEGTHE